MGKNIKKANNEVYKHKIKRTNAITMNKPNQHFAKNDSSFSKQRSKHPKRWNISLGLDKKLLQI